jgi:hypothetical protein
VEQPYVFISQIATVFYFSYFLIILPLLGFLESSFTATQAKPKL